MAHSLCYVGYFCRYGSNSSVPDLGYQADICPEGFYCPQGTVTPQMCPPGTYNPSTGIQALVDCMNCTAGYYCPDYNMTAVGSVCQQGKTFTSIFGSVFIS